MEENKNKTKEVDVKTKRKKAKIAVISLCTIVVVFIGLQVYASINGYGNVFFMIKDWTTTKNVTVQDEVFKEEKNNNTTEEENLKTDNEIKYEISKKSNAVATIKATKNGKTISKEVEMTAEIADTGTMEIPSIGTVALVAETGGEYYGVAVFQLVDNEIKKIGHINCGVDMVKDATYTVKTKGEGIVIIDAKTDKETITKEIEMTAAIDKTEVADILKCGKVVFVSESGGEYYAVKVFRASKDYTTGKIEEIKEVGTIQNNTDYVQLEPDNYAEEVMKSEQKQNINLEPDNYAEMVEIDDAYDKFLEKMSKTKTTKSTRIDIDNDGVHELIVAKGNFEAEKEVSFYTYKNGKTTELGTLEFGHSTLYKMNNKDYLLQVYGQMGSEEVYKVYIKDGKIQKEKISERQIGPDESYTKGDILLQEIIY